MRDRMPNVFQDPIDCASTPVWERGRKQSAPPTRNERTRYRGRTASDFKQVVVPDQHGLLVPVHDDGVLLDDVVLAKDDGTGYGEDCAPRLQDRSCSGRGKGSARVGMILVEGPQPPGRTCSEGDISAQVAIGDDDRLCADLERVDSAGMERGSVNRCWARG